MPPSAKSSKRAPSPSESPPSKKPRRTGTDAAGGVPSSKDDSDTLSDKSAKDGLGSTKPADVDSMFTVDTRHYFEHELVDRLTRMNKHSNPASGCYSLHTLPADAVYWGNGRSDGFRSDQFMFVQGKKVLIWALAEVVFPSLITRDGTAQATPSLKFRPLLQNDFDKLGGIITGCADPPSAEEYNDNGMWASRFVADRSTAPSQIQRFANFYDALHTYKDKKSMPKLDAAELKTGDIVLVEFYVKRYVPKNATKGDSVSSSPSTPTKGDSSITSSPVSPARTNRYYASREWAVWDIGLTLESVSLLFKGSEFYQDSDPASEDVSF